MSKPHVPREPRTDFGPPPVGYVAGVGRGAIGFTTRSDIGPARPEGAAEPTAGAGATLPLGRGRALAAAAALGIQLPGAAGAVGAPPGLTPAQIAKAREEREDMDLSESNYDEFAGYSQDLFSGLPYDAEDKEADMIYQAIDRRMDSRRKRRREENEREEEKQRNKRPTIQAEFATLKRGLTEMSDDDWANIPEALDYSRQNKFISRVRDKATPMPDSIIQSARVDNNAVAMLDPRQQKYGGLETPLGGYTTPLGAAASGDLTGLSKVRDKVLKVKLDRMADSVSGQTVVDPKGYLTDLNSIKVSTEAEVSDIKKAKLLLNSVITTNPKHAPGWIAAARLEKETGKLVAARQLIMKGCEVCPTNEDIWLEAARLNIPKNAKTILAKAVKHLPTSVKIWMRACDLEEDVESKKAVLRKALEFIPKSVALWKAAIELEKPEDAKIMLARAVELIPESVEMWLALARLEDYENAQKVLNRARQAIPTEPSIWITAAKLEEAAGKIENVDIIITKAVKSLAAHHVVIDRDAWLAMAEECERSGGVLTCQAIVRATIGLGVEEQDQKTTWTLDAENMIQKKSIETARAIYAHMLTVFPAKKSVWLAAAHLEKQFGSRESLDQLLHRAVQYCPQAEILWLMRAKERWLADDVDAARAILNDAFKAIPDSEQIWLAAVKLESENQQYDRAREILRLARERAPTPKVWRRSSNLERRLGNRQRERELLEEALKKYQDNDKLWRLYAELNIDEKKHDAARDVFKAAVKNCPSSVELWIAYAELEVSGASGAAPNWTRARAILETARLKVPKNPQLWVAAIKIEQRADNAKVAQQLTAKALQECPTAGLLWAHAIASDPRPARKQRSYDALTKCPDDPHVACAVAKLFWLDRKVKKARGWFNRAVTAGANEGDIWASFYKFELEQGTADTQAAVVKRCAEADPRNGDRWKLVRRAVENHGLKTEQLLKKVAGSMTGVFEQWGKPSD